MEKKEAASTASVALAFAVVYIVWGSTYLAIRFAIATFPPLTMAGTRFSVPGLLLIGYAVLTKAPRPTGKQIRDAAIAGILMLACGNGAVTWAEKRIDSGIAAVVLATVSSWILLLNWKFGNRKRPSASQSLGLVLGLIGTAILVMPSGAAVLGKGVDIIGACAVLGGAFAWAAGTVYARSNELPSSPWMTNGIQMLAGGLFLLFSGAAGGERLNVAGVSEKSLLSLGYLMLFGSIIAFSAYTWLNKVTTPARLGTYAYVNPAIAVLLGALLASEPITPRAVLAMGLILAGVVLLSVVRKPVLAPLPRLEKCPASGGE